MDFEAQYNNRMRVPEIDEILASWHVDAAAYRASARQELDIAYGEGEREKLDIFLPDGEAKGLFLFVHGGYWQSMDRKQSSHLARGLNARGFAVVLPSYDLCPAVTIATIVEQIRAAVIFTARRFKRPMVVSGHSAGGHLAACMLATDWKTLAPDLGFDPAPSAYPISGLFDMPPLIETSVNKACRMDQASAEALSPIRWTAPRGKQILAVFGGAESEEFHRQSRELAATWREAGVAADWRAIPDANHFTVVAPLADPESAMVRDIVALAKEPIPC